MTDLHRLQACLERAMDYAGDNRDLAFVRRMVGSALVDVEARLRYQGLEAEYAKDLKAVTAEIAQFKAEKGAA